MKAINVATLQRIKRALQKKKLTRIDSYRMQVCSCDENRRANTQDSDVCELFKDANGQFWTLSEEGGRKVYKPFRLLSNTATTTLEMQAIEHEVPVESQVA